MNLPFVILEESLRLSKVMFFKHVSAAEILSVAVEFAALSGLDTVTQALCVSLNCPIECNVFSDDLVLFMLSCNVAEFFKMLAVVFI